MEVEPFENPWIKKIRLLTNLLLLSVACNIGFVTVLVKHKVQLAAKMAGAAPVKKSVKLKNSNAEVVKNYFHLNFDELAAELNSSELLQDGYTKRDLALSCLVAYHHFDISRAVVGKELQRRQLSFIHADGGEQFDLEVYPALDETDFQLIHNFMKREKWPLTTEGLFEELKKESSLPKITSSLAQSFVSTSEFYTLYTLFRRKSDNVKASEVLQMLLEGPWKFFEEFIVEQKSAPDLTEQSMRTLLTKYVRYGVQTASLLWIQLDSDYVLRDLDDHLLKEVIDPIQEATTATTIFLKQLLCSVRSDSLREIAGRKLFSFENISINEPYDHNLALQKFLPGMFVKEKKVEERQIQKRQVAHVSNVAHVESERFMHTVKEGESLWRIAKRHQVSIADIRRVNHLKSDKLRPGQKIEIPQKK